MITVNRKVSFHRGHRKRNERGEGNSKSPKGISRVPRVSRLMALAILLDLLIRDGVVADQAELARLGHISRARQTQIMNLLCLAPDLREKVLFLARTLRGRDSITEKRLRTLAGIPSWAKQRQVWRNLLGEQPSSRCDTSWTSSSA